MHKSQVLLYLLLAFLAGVSIGSFVSLGSTTMLVIFGLGALAVMLFWRKKWALVVAGLSLIFFTFGSWRIETAKLDHGILRQFSINLTISPDGKTKINLKGYIADEPQANGDKQELILRVKQYSVPGFTRPIDEKVLIRTDLFPKYEYGQKISVTGVLDVPDFKDGSFDYQTYLAKSGIYTTMSYPKIESAEGNLSWFEQVQVDVFSGIFKIKDSFEKSVKQSVSQPNASYLNGILLGSKSQIPQELKDAFAKTSMSHVLAISGYNITIIAEIITMILLLFVRRQKAFWFSLLAITIFTIMTGAQAAVVRAAIMGMLVLLARREGRFYNVHNAIIFTAAVMVYFNPMILRYDVGFQLSFAATMGLIFLSPRLEKLFKKIPELFNLKETLIMSLSAQIMVLPLILYYFKNLSLVSLPANLLVLPTVPYAMLLGFLTGLAGLVWPFLGQVIGYLAWLLSAVELGIVVFLAKLPYASVTVNFHWVYIVLSYDLIIGYLLVTQKHHDPK